MVFQPKIEPILVNLKGGDQTYLNFNETSYY